MSLLFWRTARRAGSRTNRKVSFIPKTSASDRLPSPRPWESCGVTWPFQALGSRALGGPAPGVGQDQTPPEGTWRVGDLLVMELAGTGLSMPSKSVAHTLLIGYEGGDRPWQSPCHP